MRPVMYSLSSIIASHLIAVLVFLPSALFVPDNPDAIPSRLEDCKIEQSIIQVPTELNFGYASPGPFYVCFVVIYDDFGPWQYYVNSSDHYYELVFDDNYTARLWAKGAPPQRVEYLLGAPGIVYLPVMYQ